MGVGMVLGRIVGMVVDMVVGMMVGMVVGMVVGMGVGVVVSMGVGVRMGMGNLGSIYLFGVNRDERTVGVCNQTSMGVVNMVGVASRVCRMDGTSGGSVSQLCSVVG